MKYCGAILGCLSLADPQATMSGSGEVLFDGPVWVTVMQGIDGGGGGGAALASHGHGHSTPTERELQLCVELVKELNGGGKVGVVSRSPTDTQTHTLLKPTSFTTSLSHPPTRFLSRGIRFFFSCSRAPSPPSTCD